MHIDECSEGDKIRNNGSGDVFVVSHNYGRRLVALRAITVMNPSEWMVAVWMVGNVQLRRIADLRPGALLLNAGSSNSYVVTQVYKGFAVAVQSVVVDASEEGHWKRVVETSMRLLD